MSTSTTSSAPLNEMATSGPNSVERQRDDVARMPASRSLRPCAAMLVRSSAIEPSILTSAFSLRTSAKRLPPPEQLHRERETHDQAARRARASDGATSASLAPCSMLARSASTSAVSGSALMKGWTASGNRSDEKKTPETNPHRHDDEVHEPGDGLDGPRARRDEQTERAERQRPQHRDRGELDESIRAPARQTRACRTPTGTPTSNTSRNMRQIWNDSR